MPTEDQTLAMVRGNNKDDPSLDEEQTQEVIILQQTAFLNMCQCHFQVGDYQKSVDKATRSIKVMPTIKGYYRRGQANAKLKRWEEAANDLKSAIMIDEADPNNFHVEYQRYQKMANA